tara:strand:- start:995 stop:1750 length:756 start_codon:yes stop_codon:yes gene_type:complete
MNLNKLLSLAFLLSIQLVASGQTTTLTLDNIPSNTLCNEIWTEQNLDLSFVTATSDDCGEGSCFFDVESTFVWLYPSRLSVDLSSLQNIQKVELDVISYCGIINPQCTFAHLMDSNGMIINTVGNSNNDSLETITIENPTEGFLSELAISSCEGNVHEIRIYQNVLSNDQIGLDDDAFAIYPNPAIDIINIDVSGDLKYEVTIFDLQGRIMIRKTNQTAIDIQALPQGIYLLEIKDLDSDQKVIEKLMKGN